MFREATSIPLIWGLNLKIKVSLSFVFLVKFYERKTIAIIHLNNLNFYHDHYQKGIQEKFTDIL